MQCSKLKCNDTIHPFTSIFFFNYGEKSISHSYIKLLYVSVSEIHVQLFSVLLLV